MPATKLNATAMNAGVGDLEMLLASISLFALLLYNFFLLRLMQVVNLLL